MSSENKNSCDMQCSMKIPFFMEHLILKFITFPFPYTLTVRKTNYSFYV